MYLFRSILITLSIALGIAMAGGCAYIGPGSYDPATFDSRDYYALDHGEAGDSVPGVPGLTIGFGSSWPVFGALSQYSSNDLSPGLSFCPGFSHNPIPPVATGFAQPGRAIPPVQVSPGSRSYHFSEDGRIYQSRRAVRISSTTPRATTRATTRATRPHTSLSLSHSVSGRRSGSASVSMPRAGRGGGRATH